MDASAVKQIVSALGLIHDPGVSNSARLEAQVFLNSVEDDPQSPYYGYQLALPENNPDAKTRPLVRHYGLTLLQRLVAHKYESFDTPKKLAVRSYVVEIANKVLPDDPLYIKEKLASIWTDIAKLSWGLYLEPEPSSDARVLGWASMDLEMLDLWNNNLSTKELSLMIYRTLFEDLYILDDAVATRRLPTLLLLCTEVAVPAALMERLYTRELRALDLRADPVGWMARWVGLLRDCLGQGCATRETQTFAVRVLQTLKTCFHWVLTEVLVENDVLGLLSSCLRVEHVRVRILAVDCLHVLLNRHYSRRSNFLALVAPIFSKSALELFRGVYRQTELDPDNVDLEAYLLLKKLVELSVCFSHHLATPDMPLAPKPPPHQHLLPPELDVLGYLEFILETTCSPLLIVSGLLMSLWITILRMDEFPRVYPELNQILPQLLEVAADKLLPYELFPESHVAKKYLKADFDSAPDSGLYILNYKKLAEDIVRIATCKMPQETLSWLENRFGLFFASDLGLAVLLDPSVGGEPFYLAISQLMIAGAIVKGVSRWRIWYSDLDKAAKEKAIIDHTELLFSLLLAVVFPNPTLTKIHMQVLTHFVPVIKKNILLVLQLLERLMGLVVSAVPENEDEAAPYMEMKTALGNELSRIGMAAPEGLASRYDDLENVVLSLLASPDLLKHEEVALKCFLLVVAFRGLPVLARGPKFSQIVDPDLAAWDDPQTVQGLNHLHWFMERMGVVEIATYFGNRGITPETDLFKTQMDDEGRLLRQKLKRRWDVVFPTRATRFYFLYCFEKVQPGTEEYDAVFDLWQPRILRILPNVLRLIAQIQAYQNPDNWHDLPREVQAFLKELCAERFWHNGILTKSRDEHMEENNQATKTLRDFADLLGHKMRYIREYAFYIVDEATTLGESVYNIPNFADLLWNSLAGSTKGLTPHLWKHMLNLCYRPVVHNCPELCLSTFLEPFLEQSLPVIDTFLTGQWEKIAGLNLGGQSVDDDELLEEMMLEHTVRQITVLCSRMMIELLGQVTSKDTLVLNERQASRRKLVLGLERLLERVINMVYHILQFRDLRCCFNMVLILRGVVQEMMSQGNKFDQWLCHELLPVLLGFVTDPYYHEMALDIVALVVDVYMPLRERYEEPKAVLLEACLLSLRAVSHLEVILGKLTTPKQQRNFMHSFIISKQSDGFVKEQRELRRRAVLRKKKEETDVMSGSEVGVLGGFFGNE